MAEKILRPKIMTVGDLYCNLLSDPDWWPGAGCRIISPDGGGDHIITALRSCRSLLALNSVLTFKELAVVIQATWPLDDADPAWEGREAWIEALVGGRYSQNPAPKAMLREPVGDMDRYSVLGVVYAIHPDWLCASRLVKRGKLHGRYLVYHERGSTSYYTQDLAPYLQGFVGVPSKVGAARFRAALVARCRTIIARGQ